MDPRQNPMLPSPDASAPATQQQPTHESNAAAPPQQAAAATPAIADDGDLIEKEWVEQVKRVLQTHAGDPYEQNRALATLRADYMQKRYGKNLKLSD